MSWQINKSIGLVLDEIAEKYPERPAVKDRKKSYTYSEWNRWTDLLAKGLLEMDIKKGMHVGVWAGDGIQTLAIFYALWKIGVVVVPLCTNYKTQELEQCIAAADIKCLFVGRTVRESDCLQDCPAFRNELKIYSVSSESDLNAICRRGAMITERQLALAKWAVEPADVDTILFTSGTTGTPRPVVTTHFSRVNTMYAQARSLRATAQDCFCSALPMYHCFSLTAVILAAMCVGACVCYPENRHSETILRTIERNHCTILSAVPTLFRALLSMLKQGSFDIYSLRIGYIGG